MHFPVIRALGPLSSRTSRSHAPAKVSPRSPEGVARVSKFPASQLGLDVVVVSRTEGIGKIAPSNRGRPGLYIGTPGVGGFKASWL